MAKPGVWFVYRSHYDGPLSKRVRRLSAPSILDWFRGKMEQARTAAEPEDVADEELGGYVYGFGSFFEATQEHRLRLPRSTAALGRLLREHLYVEGWADSNILFDAHTLRALTDDDEVDLAYFFFDDEAVRRYPDRVAYLLHDEPRLPDGAADGAYRPPVEVTPLLPAGRGEGTTYVCLLTFYDSQSIPGEAVAFPGVRMPELTDHLRRTVPASKPEEWSLLYLDTWPVELRLLRAMLDPDDVALAPALTRTLTYPLDDIASSTNHTWLGICPYADARGEFLEAANPFTPRGDPARSIVQEGEHVTLFCAHTLPHFGYQQWVFFDDRWAAAHPDLASSLLRYATDWDPFPQPAPSPRRGPRAGESTG